MAHATDQISNAPVLEARQSALDGLAAAISMLGEDQANALLSLSDAALGHEFKTTLAQAVPMARQIKLELNQRTAVRADQVKPTLQSSEAETSAEAQWDSLVDKDKIQVGRQALVRANELLPAAAIWEGLGVTKQALSKAVNSGRIFTVDVGAATYYPAFYLWTDFDRKQLAKVTQALGSLPGWSKWQFFTTPSNFLGQMTPLKALALGKVDEVKKAALGFAER